jgi:hypothetical protein
MAPKKCCRTQLCVTVIHDGEDTLQTAASTAERPTPAVVQEAEIEDGDDGDLQEDLGGQKTNITQSTTILVISFPKLQTGIVYTWRLKSS